MNLKNKGSAALLLSLSLVMAACSSSNGGGGGATPSESPSGSNPPAADGSGGKTTIEFWHSLGGRNGELIDEMISRFNSSQDSVEVVGTYQGGYAETVTKLQQSVSAGTAPDLSMLERAYVQFFSDSEVLADMTPFMDSTGLSLDDFTEGLLGHSVFDDKIVSLPLNRSTPILHVNKSMLDEAGLEVPANWQELREVATALAEGSGENQVYGYSMVYDTWYPIAMITQAGGRFFNEEGTSIGFYDNGVGLKVFEYLKENQNSGALFYPPAQDSGNIVNQMFVGEKVGMIYQSTGSIGGLLESVEFDYVTAFLPADEVYANPTGGANLVMLEDSDKKEAAWEFVHWLMTSPEGAEEFIVESGYLPFTHAMVESDAIKELWEREPNRKVAYDQLEHAIDTNMHIAWQEVEQEFFSAIQAIMYDSEDIQATLDRLKSEADRILAQYN
ncbi:ABC transporter substrate-binding protein [Paenibacillus senegalensis]|uniref:ABC transporter substrate-binding protein n=1 Tax=Paenibacillus senegalensis TaxID=1465766 RepID=UPI0002888730|nr:ABC transporter substrate-binding protein [Paenibacillus senegalensis]